MGLTLCIQQSSKTSTGKVNRSHFVDRLVLTKAFSERKSGMLQLCHSTGVGMSSDAEVINHA